MTKLGSRVQGNGPQTYFRLRLRVSSSSHINQHPILFPILSPLKGSPTAGIRAFLFKPREEKQFTKKVIHFKLSWTNSSDWVMSHLQERIPREAGFQWSPWILVLSLCLTILHLILYTTVCRVTRSHIISAGMPKGNHIPGSDKIFCEFPSWAPARWEFLPYQPQGCCSWVSTPADR